MVAQLYAVYILAGGKRSQGVQKKRYKDCLKASLEEFDINTETWETQVLDRLGWQGKISKGAIFFEQNRLVEAQRKHEIRKSKAASLPHTQLRETTCVQFVAERSVPVLVYPCSHIEHHT